MPHSPSTTPNPILRRLHGPGHFRFILQPLIAVLLGLRDGIEDAKAGRPPYFWHLVFDRARRRELWTTGIATISRPLIIAFILDSLFQILVLSQWRPLGALIVGVVLIGLPYAIARGFANRVASWRFQRRRMEEERREMLKKRVG